MNFRNLFSQYKQQSLFGRYITLQEIEPILINQINKKHVTIIGNSVLEKPIYMYQIGSGKVKVFMWSQMHGNESTTTKAVFDFINFLNSDSEFANKLLKKITFCILPMLNPDGAKFYTRENANKVDLNRDSVTLSQPESILLRQMFDDFNPNFCFNLHDQRTIFGVSDTGKPATVSFLAPSFNESKEYNEVRKSAASIIFAMNTELQKHIPNQVGRFDDGFNLNCIGDKFQSLNIPTILFEAGHFPNDYNREKTREMIFISILSGLQFIYDNDVVNNELDNYLLIPQNKVCFYDIFYKNVKINYDGKEIITNFAIQYKEELFDNKIVFNAYISEIGDLKNLFSHLEHDAKGKLYSDNEDNIPKINQKANFYLDNNLIFVNGLKKV
ncbi:M14 metallopeptidase family protein [Flavobacterium sp.]|uniref:M14 family metallopeptidase n=1 Tax=Flavobacterium sp. TaxID=239 RepID=UPI003753D957